MTMLVESNLSILAQKYRGKRCWIVGSGPSLNDINLHLIPKEDFVIGLNAAITLLTHLSNAWWLYRDLRVAREVSGELIKARPAWRCWRVISHMRGWNSLKDMSLWKRYSCQVLLYNVAALIHEKTVAEEALQIAKILGFSRAYLVGIDCAAKNGKPYADALLWKECHFFNRDKPVEKPAACSSMERALENLKPAISGLEVFNTSPLCAPIFPKVSFEDAIKRKL